VPGQSGYIRDVGDAHLLLHEITASRRFIGLPTIQIMADVAKAFPRTWRQDFLLSLMKAGGIRDGAWSLCHSIMQSDTVIVNVGGCSKVPVDQGVPEGGLLGPLGFPTWFDSLAKDLRDKGLGVGIGMEVPDCWQGHPWRGHGVPDAAVVAVLVERLLSSKELPPQSWLAQSAVAEASALRALDRVAPYRLCLVLHADDPVVLASSFGAMQETTAAMAKWAWQHKAAFHVSETKTVGLYCASVEREQVISTPTEVTFPTVGMPATRIVFKDKHKWLGLWWSADLDLSHTLSVRLQAAGGTVSKLAGMVQAGQLPLAVALDLFEAKVEGSVRFARWLLVIAPNAQRAYNEAYENWARAFLGSPCRLATCTV
jgi:hypothetical protein